MDDHRTMEEAFSRKEGTKTQDMQRVGACHEIAESIMTRAKEPGSKRAFAAMGIERDAVLSDCAKGLHISARTMVCYGFIRNWSIWHRKGCTYFRTGSLKDEPDYIIDYDSHTLLKRGGPLPPVYDDEGDDGKRFAEWVDTIRKRCLEVTNLAKPLRSVHSYKHPELLEMYERVKWHIPSATNVLRGPRAECTSASQSSACDQRSTKQQLYDALRGTVEAF